MSIVEGLEILLPPELLDEINVEQIEQNIRTIWHKPMSDRKCKLLVDYIVQDLAKKISLGYGRAWGDRTETMVAQVNTTNRNLLRGMLKKYEGDIPRSDLEEKIKIIESRGVLD